MEQAVMPEAEKEVEPQQSGLPEGFKYKEDSNLPREAQAEIYRLHVENKDRRLKAKELQAQIDKLAAETSKKEEEKLKEEGKLKELLDLKEQELSELSKIKEENDNYRSHFEAKLEGMLNKLPQDQVELINESGMTLSKKLQLAEKLTENSLSQSDSPDSTRPGGEVPETKINLEDYSGPEGRKALIHLQVTNPKLYSKIIALRDQQNN